MRLEARIYASYDKHPRNFHESVDVTKTIVFSTQLHGGFADCSFTLESRLDHTMWRYRTYLGCHVDVIDEYGRKAYEGFVTNVATTEGGVQVKCYGYYMKGADVFFDMIYTEIEATTNKIPNPSFEVNVTDGWDIWGCTGTRVDTYAKFGTYCCRLETIAGDTYAGLITDNAAMIATTPDTKVTFSGFYRTDTDNMLDVTLQLEILEYDSEEDEIPLDTRVTLDPSTDDWRPFEITIVTQSNTAYIRCMVLIHPNSEGGKYLYLDGLQYEERPYYTGYCDGAQEGCTWSGTAHNSTSSRVRVTKLFKEILEDAIDMVPDWNNYPGMYYEFYYPTGAQDYTNKRVKDSIESLCKLGYATNSLRSVYFVIYEERMPYMLIYPLQGSINPDWYAYEYNIVPGSLNFNMSRDTLYNKIYAVYDNISSGSLSKTLPAEDLLSQAMYGLREGLIDNGSVEGIALAEDLRDMALDTYSTPIESYQMDITGLITHAGGMKDYPYMVRAGHQMILADIDPVYARALYVWKFSAGTIATGFVRKTTYNGATNTLTVEVSTRDIAFETVMARLGLTGGLQ